MSEKLTLLASTLETKAYQLATTAFKYRKTILSVIAIAGVGVATFAVIAPVLAQIEDLCPNIGLTCEQTSNGFLHLHSSGGNNH